MSSFARPGHETFFPGLFCSGIASEFPQSTELFGAPSLAGLDVLPVLAALGEDQLELRVYNRLPARGA